MHAGYGAKGPYLSSAESLRAPEYSIQTLLRRLSGTPFMISSRSARERNMQTPEPYLRPPRGGGEGRRG